MYPVNLLIASTLTITSLYDITVAHHCNFALDLEFNDPKLPLIADGWCDRIGWYGKDADYLLCQSLKKEEEEEDKAICCTRSC